MPVQAILSLVSGDWWSVFVLPCLWGFCKNECKKWVSLVYGHMKTELKRVQP